MRLYCYILYTSPVLKCMYTLHVATRLPRHFFHFVFGPLRGDFAFGLIKIGVDLVPFNEKNRVIFFPYVSVFGSRIYIVNDKSVWGFFFPRVHYSIKLKYIFILSKKQYKEAFVQKCYARTHACPSFFLPFFSQKPATRYTTSAHAPLLRLEHLLPGIAAR